MKQAFIVSGKSPTTMTGGLGSYSYNVARALHHLGYEVFLVGLSDKNEIVEEEFCKLVHVRAGLRILASTVAFFMMSRVARRIIGLIHGQDASEVLVFGAGIWGRVGTLVKKDAGTQTCVHAVAGYFTTFEHEYAGQVRGCPARDYGYIRHWAIRLLFAVIKFAYVPREHDALRAMDLIIVHYASTRKILLDEIPGLLPERIMVIPYFIAFYERQGEGSVTASVSHGRRLTCICRQDPRKGINILLHAIAELKNRNLDVECVIAGNGPFRLANQKLAYRLGLADRVQFPGFVSSVEKTLKQTDVFVFPSLEEGSGAISLLEAMQVGLPIVTTCCDGIPEDFVDGENGLLVPMNDYLKLADAIERVLLSPDLASALSVNVRQGYQIKFKFEKMSDGLRQAIGYLNQ